MKFTIAAIALLVADVTDGLLRGATESAVHHSAIMAFNETKRESPDKESTDRQEADLCHAVGAYKTGFVSEFTTSGGGMVCAFPLYTDSKFPLLSFAHGWGAGGFAIHGYTRMFHAMASAGFVVCAYTDCWPWCPAEWPKHQLNVLTKAREGFDIPDVPDIPDILDIPEIPHHDGIPDTGSLDMDIEEDGVGPSEPAEPPDIEILEVDISELPIREHGDVGIIGHSSGGISTLLAAYNDMVHEYSIGSAVLYDGDGASYANQNYHGVTVSLDEIDPLLPLFLPASTTLDMFGTTPQCKDHSMPNAQYLLESDQPLIVACINEMDHLDNFDNFFRQAPLLALPYIVAFFGYTLGPSDACIDSYEDILEAQLQNVSPQHYINNLFN